MVETMRFEVHYPGWGEAHLTEEQKKAIMEALDGKVKFYELSHGCWGVHTSRLIEVKDGKVEIPTDFYGYKSNKHLQGGDWLFEVDTNKKMVLITYEGNGEFYSHGQRGGWLIGVDNGHIWVVRVPRSVEGIDEALEWLKPAEVKKAEKEGKTVLRQGDFFFIKLKTKRNNFKALEGTDHVAEKVEGGWLIRHNEHTPLFLPGDGWKAVRNKAIERPSAD